VEAPLDHCFDVLMRFIIKKTAHRTRKDFFDFVKVELIQGSINQAFYSFTCLLYKIS